MLRFIIEIGPLIAFLLAYKFIGIIAATAIIVVVTIISTIVTFKIDKKISVVPLCTAVMVVIMGGLTIFTGNVTFIKMKPTILNIIFAMVLYGGTFFKKGLLKHIFGNSMEMSETHWMVFSQRWAWFFLMLAGLNEIVWRNFSENTWVYFKAFGIITLTTIFLFTQLPFLSKHGVKK